MGTTSDYGLPMDTGDHIVVKQLSRSPRVLPLGSGQALGRLAVFMNRVFHWLGDIGHSCGKSPVFGLLALFCSVVWLDSHRRLEPPTVTPLVAPKPIGTDLAFIDQVLAKRAPDLGLTLRQQLGVAIAEESAIAKYDPLLILAVIDVESSFDDGAISPKGARGLMQIKPNTLNFLEKSEGIRLTAREVETDPALRVRLGIRYLRKLHNRFRNLDLALMAYNAGPAKLDRALKARWDSELRSYPRLVRKRFRRFREGVGLDGEWALAQRTVAQR